MFRSVKKEQDKKVQSPIPPPPAPAGLNVQKRDGSVQPFDKSKLVSSMTNAGATPHQASVVSDRVVSRLDSSQTVPSAQLSSMVARSLSRVNPEASQQYTSYRNQKLSSTPAPTTTTATTVVTATPKPPIRQMPPQQPPPTSQPTTTPRPWTRPVPPQPAPASGPKAKDEIKAKKNQISNEISRAKDELARASEPTPAPKPWTRPAPHQQPAPPSQPTTTPRPWTRPVPPQQTQPTATTPTTPRLWTRPTTPQQTPPPPAPTTVVEIKPSIGPPTAPTGLKLPSTPAPGSLTISVTPSNIGGYAGEMSPATFTATAQGGITPYRYEWFEGSTIIETDKWLTIRDRDAGTYEFYCRVTDSEGSRQNSNMVTLKVLPLTPLVVHATPESVEAYVDQLTTFTATASGGKPWGGGVEPYTYLWWEIDSEGTHPRLDRPSFGVRKNSPGTYRFYCEASDAVSSQHSNTVTLCVIPGAPPVPLSVIVTPSRVLVIEGQSVTFTATASGGSPPYTYEWIEGSIGFVASNNYTIAKAPGTYSFYCRVTDSKGSRQNSNPVTLEVRPGEPLSASASPSTITCEVNQLATFTATASGGIPPLTYNWYEPSTEGVTLVGTEAVLSISKRTAGTYRFYCMVHDSGSSLKCCNWVELVAVHALEIDAGPNSELCYVNHSVTFRAAAAGGFSPYTYKWFEGSTVVGTEAVLSVTKSNVGTYTFYCEVTDSKGHTVNSNQVRLSVID